MIAASILGDPIIIGVIVGLPATVFGYLSYRRAERLDEEAVRTAMLTTQGDNVQLVIDGLERLAKNLRADNKEARELAANLARQLAACNEAYAELKRITGPS